MVARDGGRAAGRDISASAEVDPSTLLGVKDSSRGTREQLAGGMVEVQVAGVKDKQRIAWAAMKASREEFVQIDRRYRYRLVVRLFREPNVWPWCLTRILSLVPVQRKVLNLLYYIASLRPFWTLDNLELNDVSFVQGFIPFTHDC